MHTISFSLIGQRSKGGDCVLMFQRLCWIDQQRPLESKINNTMQQWIVSGKMYYIELEKLLITFKYKIISKQVLEWSRFQAISSYNMQAYE